MLNRNSKEAPITWTDRNITPLNQMEATLRYAIRVNPDKDGRSGSFTFPYHKPLDGKPHFVHVRRGMYDGHPAFSIDVGTISKDQRVFRSRAYVDFIITNKSMHFSLPGRHLYGLIDQRLPSLNSHYRIVARPGVPPEDRNCGILVEEEGKEIGTLRGQGVGTSLITMARFIAEQAEARSLVVGSIKDLTTGTPSGDFYVSLKGRMVDVREYTEMGSRRRRLTGTAVYPASHTRNHPHVFK